MHIYKQAIAIAVALLTLNGSGVIEAGSTTVRATELSPDLMLKFERGEIEELIIEFRQGDRLPVTLKAEGDLLEITEANPSYVVIKLGFWIKLQQDNIVMSLDGTTFKPIQDVITGSFSAGASSDEQNGAANAIDLIFKAFLK